MRTLTICALSLTLAAGIAFTQEKGKGGGKGGGKAKGPGLTLTTTAFPDGGVIPPKYTQDAGDAAVSPPLSWTNVPPNTQSFVLHMHDPDVALQRGTNDVIHWLVWDIPGDATGLPEGVKPEAMSANGMMQGKNNGGVVGYRGPGAPAAGPMHHYTFELYALDTKLNIHPAEDATPQATLDQVKAAMQGHINGKAVLVGRFVRSN
jgi:Raf kinase inhibitor-like YbhB/YbcL family protein